MLIEINNCTMRGEKRQESELIIVCGLNNWGRDLHQKTRKEILKSIERVVVLCKTLLCHENSQGLSLVVYS